MTALCDVVEHNLYARFIQPFSFLRKGVQLVKLYSTLAYVH